MDHLACDVGGEAWWPGLAGPPVYEPRCAAPAVYRYRGPGFVPGHWSGRCATHAQWLDRSCVDVEPTTVKKGS